MQIYETFQAIRNSNLKARQMNDYYTLLINAQALLDYVPELIEIMVDNEHEYRKYEKETLLSKEEEKMTSAKAETMAKSTESYKEYIKAKTTLDWVYESINLSKKLATDNNQELKSQIK